MHPNTYLKTFWQLDLRPQVFVAMNFASQYEARYREVIDPAIRSIRVGEINLQPYRVDISKSGDSILTDISDGIAHSRLILADVSAVGRDSISGQSYRNGNVMYEVGIALACRLPSDVLLVRDDREKFLFDVSTIPHVTLSFVDTEAAKTQLREYLVARLNEQQFVHDARVRIAIASLSGEEISLLRVTREYDEKSVWGQDVRGLPNWYALATSRMLDKGLIRVAGQFVSEKPAFKFTPLGFIVNKTVGAGLKQFPDPPEQATSAGDEAKNVDV